MCSSEGDMPHAKDGTVGGVCVSAGRDNDCARGCRQGLREQDKRACRHEGSIPVATTGARSRMGKLARGAREAGRAKAAVSESCRTVEK